jgi:tetratricopeptide (TPR) repeat protein
MATSSAPLSSQATPTLKDAEELQEKGEFLQRSGKIEAAFTAYDKAQQIFSSILGADSLQFAGICVKKAECCLLSKKPQYAFELAQKVVQIGSINKKIPSLLLSLGHEIMGGCYKAEGKVPEALSCYRQVWMLRKEKYGSGHWSIAVAEEQIGMCYKDLCRLEEALLFYQQALDNWIGSLNEKDLDLTTSAGMTRIQGCANCLKAFETTFHAHQLKQREMSQDHPVKTISEKKANHKVSDKEPPELLLEHPEGHVQVSHFQQQLLKYQKKLPSLLKDFIKRLGTRPWVIAVVHEWFALWCCSLNQPRLALRLYEHSMSQWILALDNQHPDPEATCDKMVLQRCTLCFQTYKNEVEKYQGEVATPSDNKENGKAGKVKTESPIVDELLEWLISQMPRKHPATLKEIQASLDNYRRILLQLLPAYAKRLGVGRK